MQDNYCYPAFAMTDYSIDVQFDPEEYDSELEAITTAFTDAGFPQPRVFAMLHLGVDTSPPNPRLGFDPAAAAKLLGDTIQVSGQLTPMLQQVLYGAASAVGGMGVRKFSRWLQAMCDSRRSKPYRRVELVDDRTQIVIVLTRNDLSVEDCVKLLEDLSTSAPNSRIRV